MFNSAPVLSGKLLKVVACQSPVLSRLISRKSSLIGKEVPRITLSNGHKIPVIGLGTFKSAPGEVEQAVEDAIDVGYRHIDCAYVYGNEPEIGNAIKDKISNGDVKREDLFITSKLWNTCHDPKVVKAAAQMSLKNLQLDYLDLYLINWPMAYQEVEGNLFPKNDKGELLFSNVDYVDTWKAMEALVDAGLVKSIGISNFNSKQIQRVIDAARIQPVMNQIECHPYFTQKKLIEFCRARNIHVTAYSPLGSPNHPDVKPSDTNLLDQPGLIAVAMKYNKSVAQILIRYQIELGNVVIPKSVTRRNIESNFDVFDFELTKEDVATIDELNINNRIFSFFSLLFFNGYTENNFITFSGTSFSVPLDMVNRHPHYPFKEEF